jgi:hypothetical protein
MVVTMCAERAPRAELGPSMARVGAETHLIVLGLPGLAFYTQPPPADLSASGPQASFLPPAVVQCWLDQGATLHLMIGCCTHSVWVLASASLLAGTRAAHLSSAAAWILRPLPFLLCVLFMLHALMPLCCHGGVTSASPFCL